MAHKGFEVPLIFADGSRRTITVTWLARSFPNRTSLGLLLVAIIPALILSTRSAHPATPAWYGPLLGLSGLILFVLCFVVALFCLSWLARTFGSGTVPEPLVTALAVVPVTLSNRACADLTPHCLASDSFVIGYLQGLIFWQCLTILYFLFFLRIGHGQGAGWAPASVPPDVVRIGKRDFVLSEIDRIEVEDHLLHVVCGNQTHFVHAALCDVAAQLEGHGGLRLHRSHWVALRNIETLEYAEGHTVVRLRCGKILPIARRQRHRVQEALRKAGVAA